MDPTTAISTGTSLLSNRSDAMVILVAFLALAALWIWKVHIPRVESERKLHEANKEIHQTNADTLGELCKVTTSIHATANHSNTTLRAIVEIKEIELECIDVIAEKTQCNIKDKISEARGVMRAVRVGVTD